MAQETDDIQTQLERLKSFFKLKTKKEVFAKLDIKQSTYNNYYNRGEMPSSLIKRLTVDYHINPDWLLHGKGSSLLLSSPTKYDEFFVKEPTSPYVSSECKIICEAITRRDPAHREMLIVKLLEFINSLDIPLKKD